MFSVFQFTHPGGVRRLCQTFNSVAGCFNSRTREGCDLAGDYELPSWVEFQFTHPGGVRLETTTKPHLELVFQFTHPGGVRQYGAKLRIMGRINKRNLRLEVLL